MSVYFTSFYPLCCTEAGRNAVRSFGLPPFIDGSCRREPDFENQFPCITGLCRPGFSGKLKKGDLVIYTTNKKGLGERKLVASLEVLEDPIIGHPNAANWYIGKGLALPNNLMVKQNKPFPLNQTHQMIGWGAWGNKKGSVANWNNYYKGRANSHPEVAICKIWNGRPDLTNPPEITKKDLEGIFGRIPGTQTPPKLTSEEETAFFQWISTL